MPPTASAGTSGRTRAAECSPVGARRSAAPVISLANEFRKALWPKALAALPAHGVGDGSHELVDAAEAQGKRQDVVKHLASFVPEGRLELR